MQSSGPCYIKMRPTAKLQRGPHRSSVIIDGTTADATDRQVAPAYPTRCVTGTFGICTTGEKVSVASMTAGSRNQDEWGTTMPTGSGPNGQLAKRSSASSSSSPRNSCSTAFDSTSGEDQSDQSVTIWTSSPEHVSGHRHQTVAANVRPSASVVQQTTASPW